MRTAFVARLLFPACIALVAPGIAVAQTPSDTDKMMRPLQTENADSASPPEAVVTRGWGNAKFGRIVFDWQNPVKFTAKIVGNQLRVTFKRPLKTEFKIAAKKLNRYLSELQVHGKGKFVSANLLGHYRIRSFSNENAVVIDLIPEEGATGEIETDPNAWLEKTPRIPVRAGKHPGFGRLVFDWAHEVGYDIEREGNVVRMRFDRPARIDVSRVSSTLPGRVSAASADTTKSAARVGLIIPANAKIRHFRDGVKVALDIIVPAPPPPEKSAHSPQKVPETPEQIKARTSKKAFSGDGHSDSVRSGAKKPISLTKKARRLKRQAERQRGLSEKKFKGAPLVTVETTRRGSALDVTFNWRKDVAAAVFRRGENIWILFDGRARFSLGSLKVAGEGMVEEVEQTDGSKKSLIRLKAPEHLLATVTKSGSVWKVRLAPARMTGPLVQPIEIRSDVDSNKHPAILFAAKGIDRPHVFVDRVIGDFVHVYPVRKPGVGNRVARTLVDVEVPASAAGLVLVPRRDDISLIRNAEGVYVAAPGGLSVSRSLKVSAATSRSNSGHVFGALSDWAGGSPDTFEKTKHLHLHKILVAPEGQRNRARLDLARFYIANRMAADAMGVLQVLRQQDAKFAEDVAFIALRGAAHFLLGHYASAAPNFEHRHLMNDPSVAPWRAGVAAAKGDWVKSHKLLRDARGVVSSFPKWLKSRFHLIGAESALAVNDTDSAKLWLDALRSMGLPDTEADYLKYLSAHALRLEGKPSAAKNVWRSILASGDRRVRAKAEFALVNADLKTSTLKPKQAIEKLERLGFAWRGDAFEFDLKRRLGDIHAEQGEYRASFLRLKQAASHFNDVEGAGAIAQDMRKRFRKLFLDGGANKLPPVTALALYEEFRELTPAGEDGDEMIRKLADRLVKIDLLSDAGRLLEHQVRFRLTGLERSRIGARLALIRMMNREPGKAIEALKLSVGEELPPALEVQRRYLSVRALGESGHPEKALEQLTGDVSHDAEILRLGLHWKNGQWAGVARVIRRIIPEQSVEALSPKYAELVLRWAVALTMQNDVDGLAALRHRFSDAMGKTKYSDAFKTIAGVDIGIMPDFKALVKKASDLGDFQSFLTGYREKVRSTALSAIN